MTNTLRLLILAVTAALTLGACTNGTPPTRPQVTSAPQPAEGGGNGGGMGGY